LWLYEGRTRFAEQYFNKLGLFLRLKGLELHYFSNMKCIWILVLVVLFSSCVTEDEIYDPSTDPEIEQPVDLHFDETSDSLANIPNTFPNPNGWVNDYEGVFSEAERDSLSRKIAAHHKNTGNYIYIVTTGDIAPYPSLTDYTVALDRAWTPALPDSVSSVLISFCGPCQEVRIESYDAPPSRFGEEKADEVIFEYMMPAFASGSFYIGMHSGLSEVTDYLDFIHVIQNESNL